MKAKTAAAEPAHVPPGGARAGTQDPREAQALFEALFSHQPKTDTRTPAQVAASKRAGTL